MECLLSKEDLSEEEAEGSLNFLLTNGNDALISAFLVLLRAKGETFEEVYTSLSQIIDPYINLPVLVFKVFLLSNVRTATSIYVKS